VLLDPFKLAIAVAQAAGRKLSGPTVSQLAWALGNGQGVALDREFVYLVLDNPLVGDNYLTLVTTKRPTGDKARKARINAQVISAFELECGKTDLGSRPNNGLWLPTLLASDARIWVGGSLPKPAHTTAHGYGVHWYSLDEVRQGELFFYLRKKEGNLAVYQRIGPQHFGLVQVPAAQNMVRMSEVLALLTPSGEKITGILPTGGEPTLLRKPPE